MDNFKVPIAKYLLKAAVPIDVKLILEPTTCASIQSNTSSSYLKRPYESDQSVPKLRLCKTNKIFTNQSLMDRIETNENEFIIVSHDHVKNVISIPVDVASKARSGFY